MRDNPLVKLQILGQSIWYDDIKRGMLTSGEMKQMIDDGEIVGVTSNPAIFEKAIAGSTDYDKAIDSLSKSGACSTIEALFKALVIDDIGEAADLLLPVFEKINGAVKAFPGVFGEKTEPCGSSTGGTVHGVYQRSVTEPVRPCKIKRTDH